VLVTWPTALELGNVRSVVKRYFDDGDGCWKNEGNNRSVSGLRIRQQTMANKLPPFTHHYEFLESHRQESHTPPLLM
jgi:hypothetical protein